MSLENQCLLRNQLTPLFPVLDFNEFQACPFPDVVFPLRLPLAFCNASKEVVRRGRTTTVCRIDLLIASHFYGLYSFV